MSTHWQDNGHAESRRWRPTRDFDDPTIRADLPELRIPHDLAAVTTTYLGDDTYPSTTMLGLVEELLTEEERLHYIDVLWQKGKDDTYPSPDLMTRLRDRAATASSERRIHARGMPRTTRLWS